MHDIRLRDVEDADLPHFFEFQRDERALHMAAFTAKDPHDEAAFASHWRKIRGDASIVNRTIVRGDDVVGHIAAFDEEGRREITYEIAPAEWGRGYASEALRQLLVLEPARPLYARIASDNVASRRVLMKHGFRPIAETTGFANARGAEIAETLLELR